MSARAAASDRSAVTRSSRMKFVTDGCGSPAGGRERGRQARPLRAGRASTLACISDASRSAAATAVAEIVPMEPGGR